MGGELIAFHWIYVLFIALIIGCMVKRLNTTLDRRWTRIMIVTIISFYVRIKGRKTPPVGTVYAVFAG